MADVHIPYPDAEELNLKIKVGGCRLVLRPGGDDAWIKGTYEDPTGQIPIKIVEEGGEVTITQESEIRDVFRLFGGVRTYDLKIGRKRSFRLSLETGASEVDLDLGGLPLRKLYFRHGAGKNRIDFSAPLSAELEEFDIASGAGMMEIKNIGNARLGEMEVEGGAALYRLDFGGELTRDAKVRVNTGVSTVEISVPSTTPARFEIEPLLGSMDIGDGFMKEKGGFLTRAAVNGKTPSFNVRVTVTMGLLKLAER